MNYNYKKLQDFFLSCESEKIELTFDEIEKILGAQLVNYADETFWNSKSSSMPMLSRAWKDAGYEICKSDNSLHEQITQGKIVFSKRFTYKAEIIQALVALDGEASLKEIVGFIANKNTLPAIHTNTAWERNVSAEIQRHCSQTKSYNGARELFYSVEGIGKGFWGLLSAKQTKEIENEYGIRPYEKRIIEDVNENPILSETEKMQIIKARKGQGAYREALIAKFSHCVITGCEDRRLLVASHIKPWAKCDTNQERTSCENGLLLTPLYDKLFDSGLITFGADGRIYISTSIERSDLIKISFTKNEVFDLKVSKEMKRYLEYHSDVLFEK